ncbi:MAG: TIR domain-containing protein [Mycolicibacterium sp.]|uniref:TIR domain-containing protein n=1 Tax=Mycolicibacterium sp. TaxID=2320850 RepID=UPI003D0FCEA7
MSDPDPKHVFVIHGRNDAARREMFTFLRAIGLHPIEWSEALHETGSASPYIGQVLDCAFGMAQAVVVLMTPDEIAYLLPAYKHGDDDPEAEPKPQARPNVLFEAGMAMGRDSKRTVLVELGWVRPFSDVAGRHAVRLNDSAEKRKDLAQRLRTAGCAVNLDGNDWLQTGDFSPPDPPGGGYPMGRRIPRQSGQGGARVDGRYFSRTGSSGQIQIINRTGESLTNLNAENMSEFPGRIWGFPIERLPAFKDAKLKALTINHKERFDLIVTGQTENGEDFRDSVFLDFNA